MITSDRFRELKTELDVAAARCRQRIDQAERDLISDSLQIIKQYIPPEWGDAATDEVLSMCQRQGFALGPIRREQPETD